MTRKSFITRFWKYLISYKYCGVSDQLWKASVWAPPGNQLFTSRKRIFRGALEKKEDILNTAWKSGIFLPGNRFPRGSQNKRKDFEYKLAAAYGFISFPDNIPQLDPSPPHTPHLSTTAPDSNFRSQPTSWRKWSKERLMWRSNMMWERWRGGGGVIIWLSTLVTLCFQFPNSVVFTKSNFVLPERNWLSPRQRKLHYCHCI